MTFSDQLPVGGEFKRVAIPQWNSLLRSRVFVVINKFAAGPNIHANELTKRNCTYESAILYGSREQPVVQVRRLHQRTPSPVHAWIDDGTRNRWFWALAFAFPDN